VKVTGMFKISFSAGGSVKISTEFVERSEVQTFQKSVTQARKSLTFSSAIKKKFA
jgi:hypothetical protein